MPNNLKEKIKNTRFYKEILEVQKQYYEVLGPISEALFGELGKQELTEGHIPFGLNVKVNYEEDLGRSGVLYGIAALLAEGMSFDDIFDPAKELEKKAEIGQKYLELVKNKDRRGLIEIYAKATERISNEVPLDTKDTLLDNLKNVKAVILSKLVFDVNQRMGLGGYKEELENYFNDRYPDKNEAKEQFDKVYNYVAVIQPLALTELKQFDVLSRNSNTQMVVGLIANFESWKQLKERIKNIQKDTSVEELDSIMLERTLMDITIASDFRDDSDDLVEFLVQEFDKEDPLANPREDAKAFLLNKYIGERSPEEYAKFVFEDPVKQAVGDLNLDDLVNTGLNRILVNGKPLEFPQNASNEFIEQSLYNQLLEAAIVGKKITYFTPNAETGELEPKVLDENVPKIVKENLQEKLPKTSISTDPKLRGNELAEAEELYQKNLNETEKIYMTPEFRTLMDARYNYNLVANEIAKSIFGEENGRIVRYGETLNFMGTGLENQGEINLAESGVAYAVAMLLAEGMSMEDILDTSKESEKKLEAGRRVQELAASGEEGRKELAEMADTAMRTINRGKYNEVSGDILENAANFRANFAAQIMHVLKDETNDKNLRAYASSYEIVNQLGQNPGTLNVKSANEWASEYLSAAFFTQTFRDLAKNNAYGIRYFDEKMEFFRDGREAHAAHYNEMAEALGEDAHDLLIKAGIYENSGLNADLTFQKVCFETLYESLEAVDPGYIRSSAEFRGMKKTLQDILKQFDDAEHAGSKEWYYSLEEKCNALTKFNEQYLELKAGLEPKEGSIAQKRLDFATSAERFIKAAQTTAKATGKLFETIDFYNTRKRMEQTEREVAQNLDLYHKIVGPTHEVPAANDKVTNEFLQNTFAIKKEENNYKAPESLGITDEQAELMVMLSVGTVDVSKINTNVTTQISPDGLAYNTVTVLGEDIYNRRDGFERDKMPSVERGRETVKKAFQDYENGNKQTLGKILAEGLKRYTSTFAVLEHGYVFHDDSELGISKAVAGLKVAADMYDMISQNDNIKEMLSDPSLGEHKVTQQTLETYRGAKVAYEIYKKSEEAKKDLIDMVTSRDRSQLDPQKMKEALAAIVLKNMMHQEMMSNFKVKSNALLEYIENQFNGEANIDGQDEFTLDRQRIAANMELNPKLSMGKVQRGFTLEKMEQRLQKLANSKTIDTMVKNMDTGKLALMFQKEEEFFNRAIENMIKKEPAVVKEKEPKPEKQNVNNELPFIM